MTDPTPPIETQRFRTSQTPESPRPVHAPQPSNIPVLHNQMDPVFNDTATYNIPSNQTFSPYSDSHRGFPESSTEEHDAVQSFFRGAEAESSLSQALTQTQELSNADSTAAQVNDIISLSTPTAQNTESFSLSAETSLPTIPAQPPIAQSLASGENHQDGNSTTFSSNLLNQSLQHEKPGPQGPSNKDEGGVDYQSLLDTIAQSASTAPAADSLTAPTTAAAGQDQNANSLTSVPGLPAKPPAQPTSFETRSLEPPKNTESFPVVNFHPQQAVQAANPIPTDLDMTWAGNATLNMSANGITPTLGIYQTPTEMSYPNPIDTNQANTNHPSAPSSVTGERPWSPATQLTYDRFLEEERRYVTEGIWDRFPNGSRLFVGNLPSEKVTKRDLFHIFHVHGQLAQISIKQAYGFVQFLEARSCSDALQAEQGVEIRGRKVHLEISKPQKNTRGSGASGSNKLSVRRRSRSPERSRSNNDRFGSRPSFSDYRDEPGRRRDELRSVRSPSPRGYRSREDYRTSAQSPRGHQFQDSRPRSPAFPTFPPPLPPQGFDEDAALPLSRRAPRDVPDVQLLVLDSSVASEFINWVEQLFRSKGLRASTIWLNQRLPMQAVVKRQIIEGVQAIVKLIQHNQFTQKVPLQVFDRSAGASNVNFNEYVDLDVSTAADIVLHARNRERSQTLQPPQNQYQAGTPYQTPNPYSPQVPQPPPPLQHFPAPGPPPFHPQRPPQPPPQYPYPHHQQPSQHHISATPTASTPNLQQLLANLRQTPDSQPLQINPPSVQAPRPDIGGLLSNIAAHQQNQHQNYNQHPPPPTPQGYPIQPGPQGYGGGQNPNVQNIMDQLARYQR